MLKGVNLYLIGMMGAGKSTVGRLLAKQLRYQFFDTDALIEQVAGQSISKIFAEQGEPAFRQLETQVLSQLAAYTHLTIATGGGIVLDRANWSYLQHGIVVWLDVPVEELLNRLSHDKTRPLLQTPDPLSTLQRLRAERQPLYSQADLRIDVAHHEAATQVAMRIVDTLPTILKSPTSNSHNGHQ